MGVLLAFQKWNIRVFRLIWASATFRMGKGNVSARKETFFQKRQPNSMGTKCEMWLLLPSLFKRKKQRHKFRQHFENVHRRCSSKRKHRKELFFIRYTKMEVYCVKEKRHTPPM